MATVTLKNVPEELVHALKGEAKQNRRSLNQEALARLESSLGAPRRSGGETVKALRRLHKRLAGLAPLTDAFLSRAKTDGRP
jgi:hypothetical protein